MTRADTQVRPLQLTHQFSGRHFFLCHLFTALGLPALAQGTSVERVPSPVAQVLDLMLDQRGDQSIRLGASHSVRQIFQLFNRKKATDARATTGLKSAIWPVSERVPSGKMSALYPRSR